jgi:hypothetical protein
VEDASDIVVTEINASRIGTENLIITGDADATLGGVATGITQATVDASAATGDLSVFAGAADQDITLGFGDDTLNMGDTLSDDDTLDGGAGDDTLVVDLVVDTSDDLVVKGFETIIFTDANAKSFDFTNVSGVTTVEIEALATGDLTLEELSAGVQVVISEDLANNVTINGATAGSSINVDYEVDNVTQSIITFGNEYTTINYDLSDEDVDYTIINGAFLATASTLNINITGDDDGIDFLTDFTAGVRRINVNSTVAIAMDVSGDVLNTGVELNLSGTEEDTELTVSAAQAASGGFDLIGGAGDADELIVNIATSTSAATISGFETLTISDSNSGTINMQNITGVETINISSTTGNLDVTNIADGQAVDITGLNIITLSSDDADNSINITFANDFIGGNELVVQDFATVNIDTEGVDQTGAILDLSSGVDTLVLTGESGFVLDVTSNITGVGTFDLSGFEGTAADFVAVVIDDDADVILGEDNQDVTFTLDAGGSNTITFAADLLGTVTINNFEFGFIADRIDLTALGVTNSSQLTVVYSDGDGTDANGDESFTLTSDLFDGSIILVGTYDGASDLTSESIIFA